MSYKAYFIECITNLHAGSGDANYGLVDKLVQRDLVTNHPTIHASSLKGALRHHFKNEAFVKEIFGGEGNGQTPGEIGSYNFLPADLVALPIRCTYRQYVHAFDKQIVDAVNRRSKMLLNNTEIFNLEEDAKDNLYSNNGAASQAQIYAEDVVLTPTPYKAPFKVNALGSLNDRFAYLKNDSFKELVKELPVIARNKLVDNTSKNLWYEEVVPHQSIFITYISTTEINTDFETALANDIIQIGGNATIGYGLCKFHEIKNGGTQ